LWHTFLFCLPWRCCVVPLDLDLLCWKQVSFTIVVCDRNFLLLIFYWCQWSLAATSMTLDVHLSAFMVPCEHRTWNVKAH
jgi:hypothetical protein